MIEKILYILVALDVITYNLLTFSKRWHSKKSHHFFRGIALDPVLALYLLFLVIWVGYALYRLGVLV